MRMIVASLLVVAACSKDKEADQAPSTQDMIDEASVDFARKQVAEIDKHLASDDPGAASSNCAVIKPDMPKIKKADPKLATTLEQRCGRDLALRSFTRYVEKIEAERAKDPTGRVWECSSIESYAKTVRAAGAESDAEFTALLERHAKACPKP